MKKEEVKNPNKGLHRTSHKLRRKRGQKRGQSYNLYIRAPDPILAEPSPRLNFRGTVRNIMKRMVLLMVTVGIAAQTGFAQGLRDCLPGTDQRQLCRLVSPDGRAFATLTCKIKHGFTVPPESARVWGIRSRLTLDNDGKKVYDSSYERLNSYQSQASFALDLRWSPDSRHLAYRHISTLRLIGVTGDVVFCRLPEEMAVTSFCWIDNDQLLVVSKKPSSGLDIAGKPYWYQGYIAEATGIEISIVALSGNCTRVYSAALDTPMFLFRSVDFALDEISGLSDRVAFSDGANLCIYDVAARKMLVKIGLPQKPAPKPDLTGPDMNAPEIRAVTEAMAARPAQLEGIWWPTNDQLILGMGILGGPVKSFYTYDITTKVILDKTDTLLPAWDMSYQDTDWYRSVLK